MSDLSFKCELCGELINSGDKSIRIAAEMCISDGLGGGRSDEEVVFAVFHAECVSATYADRECDVVPYLTEAREVISPAEIA